MGQNILIIEDDKSLREYSSELLQAAGHQVIGVDDAVDIVRRVRQTQADLVLMDYHLPGIDGITALKRLRAKFMALPVIIMTSDISPQVILQCFRSGANDFIGKPFDEVYLTLIVERTLDRSSLSLKDSIFSLMRYARHADDCDRSQTTSCSCGLGKVLEEATLAAAISKKT